MDHAKAAREQRREGFECAPSPVVHRNEGRREPRGPRGAERRWHPPLRRRALHTSHRARPRPPRARCVSREALGGGCGCVTYGSIVGTTFTPETLITDAGRAGTGALVLAPQGPIVALLTASSTYPSGQDPRLSITSKAARSWTTENVAAVAPMMSGPALALASGKLIAGLYDTTCGRLQLATPILEELRKLIEETAPDAVSSIKWGMPFYTLDGTMICALGGHRSHVNLILSGPAGAYADPEGRLAGEGKTGRHLKLTTLAELPRDVVRGWLRTAVELARKKASRDPPEELAWRLAEVLEVIVETSRAPEHAKESDRWRQTCPTARTASGCRRPAGAWEGASIPASWVPLADVSWSRQVGGPAGAPAPSRALSRIRHPSSPRSSSSLVYTPRASA